MECGAKKRDGTPCRTSAMPNGKCRLHGGKSPSGIASATLTAGGRYSKNLPTRFMGRYQASLNDPEILTLRDDLALYDARLEDLLGKVDTGECGETWAALLSSVHEFRAAEEAANSTDNENKRAEWRRDREVAMQTILVLCQEGMADYAAWNEVKSVLELRRRASETEMKRRVAMQTMITEDRALLMQSAFLDILRKNVTDLSILAAISSDFRKLALAGDGGRA
jgi:hypothetical protein